MNLFCEFFCTFMNRLSGLADISLALPRVIMAIWRYDFRTRVLLQTQPSVEVSSKAWFEHPTAEWWERHFLTEEYFNVARILSAPSRFLFTYTVKFSICVSCLAKFTSYLSAQNRFFLQQKIYSPTKRFDNWVVDRYSLKLLLVFVT